jgi:uncharacterized alkaline shock family protein YloU
MSRDTQLGRIEVSPTAVASIAYDAVVSCYGVVGTAAKDLAAGIATALTHDKRPGVVVHVDDGAVTIDVYVIIEYGTRIATVARSVMDVVRFRVEQALDVEVCAVNVHVEGLRVSNVD